MSIVGENEIDKRDVRVSVEDTLLKLMDTLLKLLDLGCKNVERSEWRGRKITLHYLKFKKFNAFTLYCSA